LLPAKALAQGGIYGSILGYVFDQTGSPIKGVKVTCTSPTQIGGSKTTYTNEEGYFHFSQLQPGVFEVRTSAPKLQTHVEKDLKVGISSPVELNIVLEVETVVEEVKVVQKPPMISTTTANLKEEFDLDFVSMLPFDSRENVHGQMVNEIGGAIDGGIRGGTAGQTIFMQDGFDMRGNVLTMNSSAGYEINAGGYGAINAAAPGGLVNLVTKSGSNRFEFSFNGTMDSSELRFFTDGTDAKAATYKYILNPSFSGPIVRDRLWFAFNLENMIDRNGRDRDTLGYFPDPVPYDLLHERATLKLTWQITPRNKLTSTTNLDWAWERNRTGGLGVDAAAQEARDSRRSFEGLIWESLLTDSVVFRSQVGAFMDPQNIYPQRCLTEPDICDHVPSVQNNFPRTQQLNNRNNHQRLDLYTFQFVNRLEWFLNTRRWGEHNLVVHDRFFTEQNIEKVSHPGDQFIQYSGTAPQSATYYYANDPRYEPARYGWWIGSDTIYKHLGTVSDSWRMTRYLTLTPAMSHIWGTGTNSKGDTLAQSQAWAPSMALAWDATHDGRTVVRSSFNTYVDWDFAAIARHTLGSQTSQNCQWNDSAQQFNSNCTYSGGLSKNTFGLPCGPTGVNVDGTSCRSTLGIPRTWEYTFGAEREVIQGVAISADLTYRKFLNQFNVRESNRIWNGSATALEPIGGFRNGRNETINDLETPEQAQRRYAGVTMGIKKREGRLKIYTYYTLGTLQGNLIAQSSSFGRSPGRDVYLYSYLDGDHRHEIKTNLVYLFTNWLSLGARYDYYSGQPYDRLFRNDVTGSFEDYRSARGRSPGANINDPADDRDQRLPDQMALNLHLQVNWLPIIRQRFDTYVDVLNVLALRSTYGVTENDGPAFGAPTGRKGPMFVRLGVNFRY
jgi:hypothetical protein